MANNNNNKILNVPNLRFPEFTGEWKRTKISDLLEFFSTNSLSWEQLDYENGKIRNLHYGLIHKGLPTMVDLSKETLPFVKGEAPRNYTICKDGDVAFADASEDTNDVAKAIEFINCNNEDVICGLHSIHGRDKTKSTIVGYKGYAFASFAFHKQIRRITQGTKIYSISTKNFNETYVGVPSIEEQTKIARLLFLIDERISTPNKIIDKLESLIKGIGNTLLNDSNIDGRLVKLADICHISTGKLDANAMVKEGEYPFFTCAEKPFRINDYAFDTEALLVSGNGANLGYINYYKGQFNAYQRTYVLDEFTENDQFVRIALKVFLPKRIAIEKSTSNTPYIVLSTLSEMRLFIPNEIIQKDVVKLTINLETKLSLQESLLVHYKKTKHYLLQQMFI